MEWKNYRTDPPVKKFSGQKLLIYRGDLRWRDPFFVMMREGNSDYSFDTERSWSETFLEDEIEGEDDVFYLEIPPLPESTEIKHPYNNNAIKSFAKDPIEDERDIKIKAEIEKIKKTPHEVIELKKRWEKWT